MYSYKVKIVNPLKKSDVVVRELHHYNSKFESVVSLRMKLIEQFKEHVPNTVDFSVGYYEGQQHTKVWLVTSDDLKSMYTKFSGGQLTLWCDGKSEEGKNKRKRDNTDMDTKRQEKEEDVDCIYKDLKGRHEGKFDTPKLRLWARMISSNLHDDYDSPPDIPAFSGTTPKRPRKETLSGALTEVAVAITKAITSSSDTGREQASIPPSNAGVSFPLSSAVVSPSKAVELRMRNFEQLRYLQQLFDDGILNEHEYSEQKQNILTSLRKLL